jgi:hypothetical protein
MSACGVHMKDQVVFSTGCILRTVGIVSGISSKNVSRIVLHNHSIISKFNPTTFLDYIQWKQAASKGSNSLIPMPPRLSS